MKRKHEMHFWELWEGNEKKKKSKLIFYDTKKGENNKNYRKG